MSNVEQQIRELRESLVAQGQSCSEIQEVEPGVYELKIGEVENE